MLRCGHKRLPQNITIANGDELNICLYNGGNPQSIASFDKSIIKNPIGVTETIKLYEHYDDPIDSIPLSGIDITDSEGVYLTDADGNIICTNENGEFSLLYNEVGTRQVSIFPEINYYYDTENETTKTIYVPRVETRYKTMPINAMFDGKSFDTYVTDEVSAMFNYFNEKADGEIIEYNATTGHYDFKNDVGFIVFDWDEPSTRQEKNTDNELLWYELYPYTEDAVAEYDSLWEYLNNTFPGHFFQSEETLVDDYKKVNGNVYRPISKDDEFNSTTNPNGRYLIIWGEGTGREPTDIVTAYLLDKQTYSVQVVDTVQLPVGGVAEQQLQYTTPFVVIKTVKELSFNTIGINIDTGCLDVKYNNSSFFKDDGIKMYVTAYDYVEWKENAFYKLEDGEYVKLTEKPSDWDTDASKYYQRAVKKVNNVTQSYYLNVSKLGKMTSLEIENLTEQTNYSFELPQECYKVKLMLWKNDMTPICSAWVSGG